MRIHKAYKFRLYPTKKQHILIAKTIGCSRFVFNHFLSEWNNVYKDTGKGLSYGTCPAVQKQTESGPVLHDQTDQRKHRRFGKPIEAAQIGSGPVREVQASRRRCPELPFQPTLFMLWLPKQRREESRHPKMGLPAMQGPS